MWRLRAAYHPHKGDKGWTTGLVYNGYGSRHADFSAADIVVLPYKNATQSGVVPVSYQFNRPVVLLAVADDVATGSGRSIEGIHLHDFLNGWRGELTRFGGHSQAIGMSVETRRLEHLRDSWERAAQVWSDRVAVRRFEYEIELEPGQVSAERLDQLVRLEPHGQGNRQPLIRLRGPLRLPWKARTFGRGHLSAEAIGPDGVRIRLLGWGWEQRSASLEGEFEVLGFLEKDRYRGTVLRLVDSRPSMQSPRAAREDEVTSLEGAASAVAVRHHSPKAITATESFPKVSTDQGSALF